MKVLDFHITIMIWCHLSHSRVTPAPASKGLLSKALIFNDMENRCMGPPTNVCSGTLAPSTHVGGRGHKVLTNDTQNSHFQIFMKVSVK